MNRSLCIFLTQMILLVVGLLGLLACHANYDVTPTPQPIAEKMEQIDSFRGENERRNLDHAISDNVTYMAMGDRVTTAAMQFPGPACRLRLSDIILTTLKNNRNIRVESYSLDITEDSIEAAKGIYDLLMEGSWNYRRSRSQTPIWDGPDAREEDDLIESKYYQSAYEVILSQLISTGGQLQLFGGYQNTRTYSGASRMNPFPVDPYNTWYLGAGIMHPLLKGLGAYVTNAPIQIERVNDKIAEEEFRAQVIDQIATAVQLYWDYIFALDNYEVQRLSLERARESLRVTMVKNEAGVEPPNVVLQAEAEVSRREALLIDAQRAIADTADQLKRAMNISESSKEWQYNLIPLDRPSVSPVNLDNERIYREALDYRPDYRAALLGRDLAQIDKNVNKNAKLPQLNATADFRLTGLADSSGKAIDSVETGNYYDWGVGLNFQFPLQNRRAEALYRQAESSVMQSDEQLKLIKEVIRLEVRSTVRAIEASLKSIAAFEANVRAEEAKLDSQLKRYDVGFATIFEVLDFQEDLANAQVNYLQAVVNYNKALIELQRVKASLLQDMNIQALEAESGQ